jgi:AcrR family transcriptional regulator
MDDLALAAGVTKPVFYQHFPSKRALFVAVLEDVGSRLLEVLTKATAGAETGRARVEAGFRAYFEFVESDREAFRILFGASARNDAEFADVVDQVLTDAAAAVSTLIEIPGSPEHRLVLAHALVGMAEGISRHALTDPDGPHDPDHLACWVAELAWFGLRGVRTEA